MKREDDTELTDKSAITTPTTHATGDQPYVRNNPNNSSIEVTSNSDSIGPSFPDIEPSTVGTTPAPKGLSTTEIESASTAYPIINGGPPTSPPVVAPSTAQQPLPNAFGSPGAKPRMTKKRKKFIISVVSAVVLLFLIGATIAWYFLYFQNSQRVFGAAIEKALSAKTIDYKGALTLESKTSSQSQPLRASASFDGGISNKKMSKLDLVIDYTVPGQEAVSSAPIKLNTQLDTKALYVKFIDFTSIFQSLGSGSDLSPKLSEFVTKYNDKWIQFDLEKGATKQERSKISQCIDTQLKQIGSKDSGSPEAKELQDIYMKNQFLILNKDLGSQTIDGTASTGYTVSFDISKLGSYVDGIASSGFIKNIKDCESSFNLDASSINKSLSSISQVPELKVWIGTFSHEFTRIEAAQKQTNTTLKFLMEPHFNQPVTIDAPKNPVSSGVVGEDLSRAFFQAEPGGQATFFNPYSTLNLGGPGEQITPVILDTDETIQPLPNRT